MDRFRPKRQKVAVACDPCRSRKIKCDGRAPVCEPCQKRSRDSACTWDTSPAKANVQIPPDRIKWLEDRIKQLEQGSVPNDSTQSNTSLILDDSYQSTMPQVNNPRTTSRSYLLENSPLGSFGGNNYASIRPQGEISQPQPHSGDSIISAPIVGEVSPSETRSVHAIIGTTMNEDRRDGFFGSASAGSFMQNVKKLVEQKMGKAESSSTPIPSGSHTNLPIVPASASRPKQIDYILPSRKRADSLMALYWKFVQDLYPWLDKAQVQEDYDKVWSGDDSVSEERSFLCLLNIIFCLTCQIDASLDPEQRQHSAAVFYTRARELLDVAEMASVRSVQCFLLLGQYFQTTNEPHPCWVFVGLAVLTAQSLGLHLPATSESVSDARTREVLRRVWYGCVLMDNVTSMVYGRPSMIGPRTATLVPLPIPLDDEYLPAGASSQQDGQERRSSLIDCYVASVELYEILHDVLFNFHSTSAEIQPNVTVDKIYDKYLAGATSTGGNTNVFELERRLARWESNVPDHLRLENYSRHDDEKPVFYRQAVIIHQRHLHVHLLLLRPILSTFITTDLGDGSQRIPLGSLLSHRIFLQCAIVCVKIASDAIDTIHAGETMNSDSTETLSAWWYNVLFLYTSATVLIAARLSPSILAEIPEESILERWNKAVELLEGYGSKFGTTINRMTTTLRLLFDAVPQQYSRLRHQTRQNETDVAQMIQAQPQNTTQTSYWRPSDPAGLPSSGFYDPARDYPQDADILLGGNDPFSSGFWADFDAGFDPNDFSWLMTVPVND